MWTHQFQFCGFYHAKESFDHGSPRGHGIELLEGGTPRGLDPIACVMEGIDDFGVATALDLIRCYHENHRFEEFGIVPCLVIFRRSPVVIIAHQNNPISLADLEGAQVAFAGRSDSTFREFEFLAKDNKLAYTPIFLEENRKIVEPLSILRNGDKVYRIGYAFNEGLVSDPEGSFSIKYLFDLFSVQLYSDVLFTTHRFMRDRRQLCLDLSRKILEGYIKCSSTANTNTCWHLIKEFCPDQYTQFGKATKETGFRPFETAIPMLERCLADPQHDGCLIGSAVDWERMDKLVVRTIPGRADFLDYLKNKRLFDFA